MSVTQNINANRMHKSGPRIMFLASLCAAVLVSACGGDSDDSTADNTRPSAEMPFSFDAPRQTRTVLRLEAVSGTVDITGVPGVTSISVTGVRLVEANTLEDATAHLADLDVVFDSSSSTEIVVSTVQPRLSAGRNYIVNYTIAMPPDMAVNVAAVNGDISVASIDANCMVASVNGRIHADSITGDAILSLVNGEITASVTLPSRGQVEMSIANGDIDLQIPQATSAEFTARVGIGNITITNLLLSNETVKSGSHSGTLGTSDGTISLDAAIGSIAVQGI